MILTIVALILILAIAFYQVVQGFFSALIMTILTILCAAAAFTFYEPLAELLYTRQPGYADAAALITLFVLPLFGLRYAIDRYIPGNVVLGVWADRIGGGILGILTGTILTGMLLVAVQMLPVGKSFLTFKPFDDTLKRNQSLAPFSPDQFTVGLAGMLSDNSLKGDRSFAANHDDLLLDAFCIRNTAGKNGRVDAPPTALKGVQVFQPGDAKWQKDLPKNPLMEPTELSKLLVVRCKIDAAARDEKGDKDGNDPVERFRLPATHFRMLTIDGHSHYPIAYLTFYSGGWQAHAAPVDDEGRAEIAKLLIVRPGKRTALTVDWVYCIPKDQEPKQIIFRRTAKSKTIRKIDVNAMPAAREALDRDGSKDVHPRRRRR